MFVATSLWLFGRPVLGHLGSRIIASNDGDPNAFTWFFAWWPHAVLHGLNPFITHAIFAPGSYNLAWVTSVPGPSLLMAPVTLAFGPVVAWNVLTLMAPAIAAWTAFLLCRHLVHATAPSLVGGYIFGFSPYMLTMLQGSPNLYLVALVPVLALLVIRRVEGSIRERSFLILTALALALQALASLEILLTTTVFGAIALLSGFAVLPDKRPALLRTGKLLLGAYAASAVLISPMLYSMAFHSYTAPAQSVAAFALDLASWFVPGPVMEVVHSHRLSGAPSYYGGPGYLGIPLAIIALAYAWRYFHRRSARLAMICLVVPAVASLGGRLIIAGSSTAVGLPWSVFAELPGLSRAVPQRFPLFTFLALAVIVAMWLAWHVSLARWALALFAVAFIVPDIGSRAWRYTLPPTPGFFTSGRYHHYLRASDRVLLFPIIDGERWQAEAGFGFKLAGGYVGAFPASYKRYPIFAGLITGFLPSDYEYQLRRFVNDKGVTAVAVAKLDSGALTQKLFGSLGVRPIDDDGVLLYRLRGT